MVIAALAFNPQHSAREPVFGDRALNRLIHQGEFGEIESVRRRRCDRGRESQGKEKQKRDA
jgi:hypothetical protein